MATGKISEAAKTHLELIKSGDLPAAYADTSEGFKDITSFEEYENFIIEFAVLEKHESVSFSYRNIHNSEGYVEGTIKEPDGTAYPIRVDLIKENGEWKVFGISLEEFDEEYVEDDFGFTEIPTIYQLKSSVDLAEDGSLIDEKDVFSPDERITLSGYISILPKGTTMVGTMYDSEDNAYYSTAVEFEQSGSDAQFYFFVDPTTGDLEPGNYMLEAMFEHESFGEAIFGFHFITVE